ncbi:hypothetical protein FHG87_021119 [Trinorchestia longiramus]|nr:hypothetical protein FHG87_021119 [Trinorchestia longiramus]
MNRCVHYSRESLLMNRLYRSGECLVNLDNWFNVSFVMPYKAYANMPIGSYFNLACVWRRRRRVQRYMSVLLLRERRALVAAASPPVSPTVRRLMDVLSPTSTLGKIAADADLIHSHVVDVVGHYIHWGYMMVIYPVCAKNLYVMSSKAPEIICQHGLCGRFDERFPKSGVQLYQVLQLFRSPLSPHEFTEFALTLNKKVSNPITRTSTSLQALEGLLRRACITEPDCPDTHLLGYFSENTTDLTLIKEFSSRDPVLEDDSGDTLVDCNTPELYKSSIFPVVSSNSQSHTSNSQSHTSNSQSHTSTSQSHTSTSQSHTSTSQSYTSTSQSHTSTSQSHTSNSQSHTRNIQPGTASQLKAEGFSDHRGAPQATAGSGPAEPEEEAELLALLQKAALTPLERCAALTLYASHASIISMDDLRTFIRLDATSRVVGYRYEESNVRAKVRLIAEAAAAVAVLLSCSCCSYCSCSCSAAAAVPAAAVLAQLQLFLLQLFGLLCCPSRAMIGSSSCHLH